MGNRKEKISSFGIIHKQEVAIPSFKGRNHKRGYLPNPFSSALDCTYLAFVLTDGQVVGQIKMANETGKRVPAQKVKHVSNSQLKQPLISKKFTSFEVHDRRPQRRVAHRQNICSSCQ